MLIIYRIAIYFYQVAIFLSQPFNTKAKKWLKGRKGLFRRLEESITSGKPLIWFHCASLGEFEQGRPLIEAIKKDKPGYQILLTFFSPSGYEIRKNYQYADLVFYMPLDTPQNARRFIQITRPSLAVFVKYEFWYYHLNQLNKNNIPACLVSGIFRKNQFFFSFLGNSYLKWLHLFDHLFVQNEESAYLLKSRHINHVTLAGDTRFDRVYQIASQAQTPDLVKQFKNDKNILIGGSTWPADEDLLLAWVNKQTRAEWKYIIAPHEVHKQHIEKILQKCHKKTIRYSDLNQENAQKHEVLIVDNIGMLSALYACGNIAYVGGGFGQGIHNILEPATFGIPIIFGPNHQKFQEAIELKSQGGAFSIGDNQELAHILNFLTSSEREREEAGNISANYVLKNKGASEMILSTLYNRLNQQTFLVP